MKNASSVFRAVSTAEAGSDVTMTTADVTSRDVTDEDGATDELMETS